MGEGTITTEVFDQRGATDDQIETLHRINVDSERERMPEDPPVPLEIMRRSIRAMPSITDTTRIVVRRDDDVVAAASMGVDHEGGNEHVAFCGVWVHPDHRRQGHGTRLLGDVTRLAVDAGRTSMWFFTTDRVESGRHFAEHHGLRLGMRTHFNRLVLTEVDRAMVDVWIDEGPAKAPGYRLEWIPAPTLDEHMDLVVAAYTAMNDAPREDLDINDEVITPEIVREWEAAAAKVGSERWRLFAFGPDDDFAGYTDVKFSPANPTTVWQGGTAVVPSHRGHGLGKWLKATMMARILDERPERLDFRTANADSNGPMLDINTALGYRPWIAELIWQIPTADAVERFTSA